MRGPHQSADKDSPTASDATPHFEHVEAKLRAIATRQRYTHSGGRAQGRAGQLACPIGRAYPDGRRLYPFDSSPCSRRRRSASAHPHGSISISIPADHITSASHGSMYTPMRTPTNRVALAKPQQGLATLATHGHQAYLPTQVQVHATACAVLMLIFMWMRC